MTESNHNGDESVTVKAEQLLRQSMQERLNTAEAAGEASRKFADLQASLAEAETKLETAWRDAINAGWQEKELRQIGLTKPGTRTRRNRTNRAQTSRSRNQESAETNADDSNG